ncbi:MFS transporter [Rugosimonospora africana]|uniref:MFS transporter n=1 Tax=Rugosimonospora africana TaxID=556532 RepID=A0A8J3QPD0_9ACTN|nr:MFS transporter [Rugosimonospora africana]GIH13757.1 MFS transporter [Rugosimonospora africana]
MSLIDAPPRRATRIHRAWAVAAVALVATVGAAGFRATPGVLITPLQQEFGWSRGTISFAVSVNLILYGLTSPFAAALMERFGLRRVVGAALVLVAAGSGLTVFMTASWQLVLCWGVLVGLGTGSMALAFVATVTSRWFVRHRGVVTGVLTAGGAAGQLCFLPLLAYLVGHSGWRAAALVVAVAALVVAPLALWLLRDHPRDLGLEPYGAEPPAEDPGAMAQIDLGAAGPRITEQRDAARPAASTGGSPVPAGGSAGPARRALTALRDASRVPTFWLLAGSFAICGATTNGLVGTHFIPAAHDHGLPTTTAAGLLALVGVFDIVGTIFSGALTDRFDSRLLLACYYALRGLSLLVLPDLFASTPHPSMLIFILFYGLDWVATVPPTIALCRERFGDSGPVVFGWVFAAHQIGAAVAATGAGLIRDDLGTYDTAFYLAGGLALVASLLSAWVRRPGQTGARWRVAFEE